jgi:RecQ family ATP-dependent DNA helicase
MGATPTPPQPTGEARPIPEELLARFGLPSFRPGQREAVAAALGGRDSLVVMPTGGGKSLCYQLPALAGTGLVVVVSPLIALMADQLERMRRAGLEAAMLASGMAEGHNREALSAIGEGRARLALAAPERFASGAFREALGRREVALFVVDEAHCVAEWGHDFRPDYLRLEGAIAALGRPPVMAATATATPRVAAEIAARLGLEDPVEVRSGFDRPNLVFDVVAVEGKGALGRKRAALLRVLGEETARPAIVYCGTRRDTEAVAELIAGAGIATVAYHAGMAAGRRRESQEAFMSGAAAVVVATNAFGMGVDKADVRTVAHWAIPTSLEAYYQEAGRGGRDGLPARALLLAGRMDLGRLIRFNTERDMTVGDVRAYVGRLRRHAEDGRVTIAPSWAQGSGGQVPEDSPHGPVMGERDRLLLSVAERAGALELEPAPGGGLRVTLTGRGDPRKARAAIRAAKDRGWEAYRSVERFIANGERCRRRQILDHFGDDTPGAPSGRCCDVCEPDGELRAALRATAGQARTGGRGRGAPTGAFAGPPEGVAGGIGDPAGGRRASTVEPFEAGEQPPAPVVEAHFEALRAWRLEEAAGKPAYTVASNAVLEEVLRRRPQGRAELLAIRGIGEAFCEKHGESLLAALAGLATSELAA